MLELLIEHKREQFKIEDDRLRAVDVQAATIAAIGVAALAVVAPAFARAIDRETLTRQCFGCSALRLRCSPS